MNLQLYGKITHPDPKAYTFIQNYGAIRSIYAHSNLIDGIIKVFCDRFGDTSKIIYVPKSWECKKDEYNFRKACGHIDEFQSRNFELHHIFQIRNLQQYGWIEFRLEFGNYSQDKNGFPSEMMLEEITVVNSNCAPSVFDFELNCIRKDLDFFVMNYQVKNAAQ